MPNARKKILLTFLCYICYAVAVTTTVSRNKISTVGNPFVTLACSSSPCVHGICVDQINRYTKIIFKHHKLKVDKKNSQC